MPRSTVRYKAFKLTYFGFFDLFISNLITFFIWFLCASTGSCKKIVCEIKADGFQMKLWPGF